MSVSVRGTIVVQTKKGRNGAFNVGDLITEIGEFEVKDSLIEEFQEGRYEGTFLINWIEPESFSWRGRVFVKNRATLEAIFIDDEVADQEADQPTTPPVVDPIEEAPKEKPSQAPTLVERADSGAAPADDAAETVKEKDVLFDEEATSLIQSGSPIKLDPTIDRVRFRMQRDALKEMGYRFDVKGQSWAKEA